MTNPPRSLWLPALFTVLALATLLLPVDKQMLALWMLMVEFRIAVLFHFKGPKEMSA